MSVRSHAHRITGAAVDFEAREPDDFYPTPPEGTQALLSVERFDGPIWEPACGDGAISRELESAGYSVVSSDLMDRGFGEARTDFLMEWQPRAPNIVTNPPFKLASKFVDRAVQLASRKAAFLLRLAFLEGSDRYRSIYSRTPPARVWVFSGRLKFYRPGWEDTGSGGLLPFAWFVWDREHSGPTQIGWLPPEASAPYDPAENARRGYEVAIAACRDKLERAE